MIAAHSNATMIQGSCLFFRTGARGSSLVADTPEGAETSDAVVSALNVSGALLQVSAVSWSLPVTAAIGTRSNASSSG